MHLSCNWFDGFLKLAKTNYSNLKIAMRAKQYLVIIKIYTKVDYFVMLLHISTCSSGIGWLISSCPSL